MLFTITSLINVFKPSCLKRNIPFAMTVACKYPKWFLLLKIYCNLALAVLRICASLITSTKLNIVYQLNLRETQQLKIRHKPQTFIGNMDAKSPSSDPFYRKIIIIQEGKIQEIIRYSPKETTKPNENKIMTLKFSFASLFN